MATVRPIRETISLDDARALILDAAVPIERTERIDIRAAHGRVVAQTAISAFDVPPFDRAAMDGYAVIAEDTFGASTFDPKTLRCIESVFTGQLPRERVSRGS
jgi:molybdopterin molybdotransferase